MKLNKHFLLIEDNLIDQLVFQKLLKRHLETPDITVTNNGLEALNYLQSAQINQDLTIILDVQMPTMNGYIFLEEFHKLNPEIKAKCKIFVASSTLEIDEINVLRSNQYVSEFLTKPVPMEHFIRILNTNN